MVVFVEDLDVFDATVLPGHSVAVFTPHTLGKIAGGPAGFCRDPDGVRAGADQRDPIVAKIDAAHWALPLAAATATASSWITSPMSPFCQRSRIFSVVLSRLGAARRKTNSSSRQTASSSSSSWQTSISWIGVRPS